MPPRPALLRPLPALALGLALGAAGVGVIRVVVTSRIPLSTLGPAEPAAVVTLSPWSWRDPAGPAALDAAETTAAVAAWLDLRAADGTPAGFPARAEALRALLLRLPAEAFPRLLTPLAARAADDDQHLLEQAFAAWVELDPAAATRWAATLPADRRPDRPGHRQELLARALDAWVHRDPEAAATWACGLADEKLAASLARSALAVLAERDPARAAALAGSRGEAFIQETGVALFEAMVKKDAVAALQTYGPQLWRQGEGLWQLREALSAWIERDPHAALAWVCARPRRSDEELGRQLGNLWGGGDEDRRGILDALSTVPGVPGRQQALGHILFSWGASHPEQALAWLDSLPDRDLRTALLEQASHITYTEHPEQSLPLSLAMPEGQDRRRRLADLLTRWADRDASAALAWMQEHDDPDVAAAAPAISATLLANIARDEPATAVAEWEQLTDPAAKQAGISAIADAWAKRDPGAAFQWQDAQQRALHPGSRQLNQDLLFAWARQDPVAALHWAEAQPGDLASNALGTLAGTWRERADRTATADLYTQIKDPDLRATVLTNHLREWHGKDPAAARAWIESHDALNPQQAAAILTGAPPSGP